MTEEELRTLFDSYLQKVNKIHEIFIHQFTESKVDLQGNLAFGTFKANYNLTPSGEFNPIGYFGTFNLYVYWPEVKITNESNHSHQIKDLYALVQFRIDGKLIGKFKLNRTTYTEAEWNSDYMHSHVPGIPKSNPSEFSSVCTGSGPINSSITILQRSYDEDWWGAFAYELDRYVYVESIAGVPYRRMSNISLVRHRGNYPISIDINHFGTLRDLRNVNEKSYVRNFLRYYLHNNNLRFSCSGYEYQISLYPTEFWLQLSNAFIDWVNTVNPINLDNILADGVLMEAQKRNGQFYKIERHVPPTARRTRVLTFKGEEKRLNIIRQTVEGPLENIQYILNPTIVSRFYMVLERFINYYYGREQRQEVNSVTA